MKEPGKISADAKVPLAMNWRLILDGNLPGSLNMARDMAVLETVSAGDSPPTLRLYGWNPPCLTIGKHQGLDAVDLDFCRREGIDVVRRPTGGRALLHHLELTYSVVAPLGTPPLPTQQIPEPSPTVEGEATSYYLQRMAKKHAIRITRIGNFYNVGIINRIG